MVDEDIVVPQPERRPESLVVEAFAVFGQETSPGLKVVLRGVYESAVEIPDSSERRQGVLLIRVCASTDLRAPARLGWSEAEVGRTRPPSIGSRCPIG